ncbi:hypothetical protein [Pseudarthrobacter sp. S9]|uniref:hypothetical protein n=1 Tax=Pseudarthrobacter sp. S9 TaxID=3418421 RepID=UPI003CFD5E59
MDLRIPKEDVHRFAKRPDVVSELVEQGFWTDAGSAYVIRHHAQYQRTREAVIKQQEVNRENGGKGGRPKGKAREQVQDVTKLETHSPAEPLTESKTQGITGVSEKGPEMAQNQGPENPANSRVKTQSRIESPSKSETERDRTGREKVVITPSTSKPEQGNRIDPAYPTEPNAITWRQQIDAQGITSQAQLVEVSGYLPEQVRKMWLAAFPESRAA